MTRSDVALIAFRLAAIWFLASAFFAATSFGSLLGAGLTDTNAYLWAIVALSLRVGMALVLWWRAETWARLVGGDEATDPPADRLAITTIGFRVVGFLGLDHWIQFWPWLFAPILGLDSFGDVTTPKLVCGALVGGVSTAMVVKPQWWSKRMFGATAASDVPASHLVQGLAFAFLGAWILAGALPELVDGLQSESSRTGSLFGLSSSESGEGSTWAWPTWANLFRVALGLALFTGAAWWSRLWHRLRTAGLPASEPPTRRHPRVPTPAPDTGDVSRNP